MASQVAWLAFDADQQRRTELMMLALADQGTIDELGMGLIRDLVARVLHPNLTVQHTRAKYLVFIPRIYRSLSERTTDRMMQQGRKAEGKLIQDLVEYYRGSEELDDRGIIGRRRGEDTKQLASASYWPLLRALGIQTEGSVTEFCRRRTEAIAASHAKSLLHSDEEPEQFEYQPSLELPADEGGEVSFDLSLDEAEWVRQRFVGAEAGAEHERSLLSWLLDPARDYWVEDLDRPWNHPQRGDFPAETATAMWVGYDVDRLVHGARILYNWLCARGRPLGDRRDELMDKYARAMVAWHESIADEGVPGPDRLAEIDAWTRKRLDEVGGSRRAQLRWQLSAQFLGSWSVLADGETDLLASPAAARLVVEREAKLKPGRARLQDPALLTDWDGDSGYFHMDFNWGVARRILADVHRGLGTPVVSMEDAG